MAISLVFISCGYILSEESGKYINRLATARRQADMLSRWYGHYSGQYEVSQYLPDGITNAHYSGIFSMLFASNGICIRITADMGKDKNSIAYVINTPARIVSCNGSQRIESIHSLPFNPYEIVQRPSYDESWSMYWNPEHYNIEHVETGTITLATTCYDKGKTVFIVSNTKPLEGRVHSYSRYMHAPGNGDDMVERTQYEYYGDYYYPDRITIIENAAEVNKESAKGYRVYEKKRTVIEVLNRDLDAETEDCSCDSLWISRDALDSVVSRVTPGI